MPVDDFAADITTTGVLPMGGSANGSFESSGDTDWFAINVTAGQHVEVSGPWWLMDILVYDAAGNPVTLDFFQQRDFALDTKISGFTATTSGTYYVGVEGSGLGDNYTLSAALGTGANPNSLSSLPKFTDGDTASGQLGPTDSKWFAADLAAGQTIVVDNTQILFAYSPAGRHLETVFRVGETSLEPFNYFTATAAGTYYFRALNNQPGAYALGVDIYADDYADGEGAYGAAAETHGVLAGTGDQLSGQIEMLSDIDHFDFNLVAGQTVRLRLDFTQLHSFKTAFEVSYGGTGFGVSGVYVAQLQTEELGELIFTAPQTGTYHLDVAGSPTYRGGYNLSIETVSAGAQFDGLPSIVTPPTARPAQPTHATTVEYINGGTVNIAAGTTIYTVNIDKRDLPPGSFYFGYGGSPAVQASNSPQFSTILKNAGVIRNYNDNGKDASGVGVDTLINSGSIIAETTSPYLGRAYTIHGSAMAVKLLNGNVTNTGLIQASAELGNAFGIRTGSTGKTITNSGVISAAATVGPDPQFNGYAAAIYSDNDVRVVNSASGKILAEADGIAVGIYLTRQGSVENRGLIEAHSRGIYAESIGIRYDTIGPGLLNTSEFLADAGIHNYGIIRADLAIVGEDAAASPATHPQQGVFNHTGGLIEGDILLGTGNDAVWNQGVITGHVDMGADHDLFDNTGGKVNGVVDLGADADEFSGGSFADFARGGLGDDTLTGNGGDDLLLGGYGKDVLIGGAGSDSLYGETNADRIVTQGDDIADGGSGGDRIETGDLTFVSIAGGAGHDVWSLPVGARTLDLGLVAASGRVSGIEEIELSGGQTIVVHPADVAGLSGGVSLFLSGSSSDAVYLAGLWTVGASVQFNGVTYARYILSGATVFVETGVGVSVGAAPPVGSGLDPAAPGAPPAPGIIPGADLSPAELTTRGETLSNTTVISADEIWQNLRGDPVIGVDNESIAFFNEGTIQSFGSTDADLSGPTGSASAFSANLMDVFNNSGLIVATAFGAGFAQGYLGATRHGFINQASGRLHAFSEAGDAVALLGADGTTVDGGAAVDNQGDIFAFSSSGFAVGLFERNKVRVENSGVIEADGGSGAIAVDLINAGGEVINNGDIIAFAPLTSNFFSVGVSIYSQAYIENHGLISADIAISILGRYGFTSTIINTGTIHGLITKSYWGPEEGGFGGIDLTNSGSLFGSVVLTEGQSRSTIINTGHIEGIIAFGSGSDIYDGRGGDIAGRVEGGGGNDILTGGAEADEFSGGDGDDTLDGGAGFDTASYLDALSGVSVSLAIAGAQNTFGAGIDTLISFENLAGSNFADTLIGNSGANVLSGGAGNDTLIGGLGNDTLDGGLGADTASYATATSGVSVSLAIIGAQNTFNAGIDTLVDIENLTGSAFGDTLTGNAGANVLSGGAGVDTLIGGLGDDTLIGGDNTDFIVDLSGIVSIDGGAGNEQITLGAAVVSGTVDGGTGTDQLTKGGSIAGLTLVSIEILNTNGGIVTGSAAQFESFDTIRYSAGQLSTAISLVLSQAGTVDLTDELLGRRVIFVGTSGNDTITTSNGSDNIDGGAGDDVLSGGLGVDTLIGGLGNDTLSGGDGGDFIVDLSGVMAIDAGDGDDVMTVGATVSSGVIAGGLGIDQLNKGGAINGLTISGIEIVNTNGGTLLATAAQLESFDTIRFSAALATSAVSLALSEAGTVDLTDELLGRRALFAGSSGNDTITTSNGSDQIDGGDGDDVLSGGAGVDTLIGGLGDDTLNGGDGNDFIVDLSGVVAIDGGDGDDIITVGAAVSSGTIAGGLGTDQLNKGGAIDGITITGIEIVNTNGGTLLATAAQLESFDAIRFSAALPTTRVNLALAAAGTVDLTDELLGGRAQITGSSGDDVITTSNGADTLLGGAGSDTLNGGAGADTVYGELGDDLIIQGATDGRDYIDGGTGTDTYQLNGTAAAETFRIMTRAEAVLAGITGLAGATEIVITKDGTDTASVIAELNDIEEIQINTLLTTANNGNGVVDGGTDTGDTIIVIGDFTTTSLAYSTIHIAGSSANDTVDISGLSSAHRIVFDANGGSDAIIGAVRPQDVVTGIPGISASNLHVGAGIESDFDLMELMASNLSSSQTLLDDATLRSGLEDASMAMPGHASPFDHAIGLIDRADTADVRIHQITTDYAHLVI